MSHGNNQKKGKTMKLKTLLLIILIGTISLWGGFSNIDCNNEGNLTVLHITKGDCKAIEAFWDATGKGDAWKDKKGWDELPLKPITNWAGFFRLNDDNQSLRIFNVIDLNISGTLPEALSSFTNLKVFIVDGNHFSNLPDSIKNMQSLRTLGLGRCDYSGALPDDLNLPNLKKLYLDSNHFTGSIPKNYKNFTKLQRLILYDNNLSGPLPDLSALTNLQDFEIYHNQFTFADIEPQMGWISKIKHESHIYQMGHYDNYIVYNTNYPDPRRHCHDYYTDERHRVVYFDKTLRIEPREVPQNTYSNHDFFAWFQYNIYGDKERDVTTDGSRIYIKHNATKADEGEYYYEANNSVVSTLDYDNDRLYYCSTPREDGIRAIYDHTPVVSNIPSSPVTIHIGDDYSYEPNATDADGDSLEYNITNKPSWAHVDLATGRVYGTPIDIGSYDINITVTDIDGYGKPKIPVHVNYTLTVLPKNITSIENGYEHNTTHNQILSTITPSLHATQSNNPESFGFIEGNNCNSGSRAYIGVDSDGKLITGYKDCNSDTFLSTLQDNSTYPNKSKATLKPKPDSNSEAMIEVEVPLNKGQSITVAGE